MTESVVVIVVGIIAAFLAFRFIAGMIKFAVLALIIVAALVLMGVLG